MLSDHGFACSVQNAGPPQARHFPTERLTSGWDPVGVCPTARWVLQHVPEEGAAGNGELGGSVSA